MYEYQYPRAGITTDIVLFYIPREEISTVRDGYKTITDTAQVLLITRGNEPDKGKLAVPGRFLNMDETLYQCAVRELKEETCLDYHALSPVGIHDAVNRDPRGRTITQSYVGLTLRVLPAKAADDAATVGWYRIKDIFDKPNCLALDHWYIICAAYNHLHNLLGANQCVVQRDYVHFLR